MRLSIKFIPNAILFGWLNVWEKIMFGEPLREVPKTPPYTFNEIAEELTERGFV